MVKPDPGHQARLRALTQLTPGDLRRCIDIESRVDTEYVPSEVLASLIRLRFGQKDGVLDRAAAVLYKRLMTLIGSYFKKNPQWYGIVNASSETLQEATAQAWLVLNEDENPVSFAEVRFLPWVEGRVQDYLRAQLAQKNQMRSYDAMADGEDEGGSAQENLMVADEDDAPDRTYERKELSTRLHKLMETWEKHIRDAVYYRLECQYDWEKICKFMNISKPTARKYYAIGFERLKGASE